MGSLPRKHFDVKKIAIIGAGPCGLCAAKYLKAQAAFDRIVIFEQQDEIGGVWNYSDRTPGPYPVPQQDPFLAPDEPLPRDDGSAGAPIFPSPMYEKLHANIQGTLMRFSDNPFPAGGWVFPKRETIQDYLLQYAQDVRDLVRFSFQVTKVSPSLPHQQIGKEKWVLEARSTVTGEIVSDTFDAVVVANGHYATPFIPDIRSAKDFQQAHPSVIIHSKQYRTPEAFRDKKVILVGNGPSGTDIARQISAHCKQPALLSVKDATPEERLRHTGCREVPEIVEFLMDQRGVRFADGSVETDIDAVVFCTGFLYSYPFLQDLQPKLISNGRKVHGLYQHFINIDHPTIVFPGLNIKAIPWPLFEAQAAVYSALWSNQLELPAEEEMREWNKKIEEEKGNKLHILKPLEDGRYINEMHDWAIQATFLGKQPPRWDDEAFWQREIFTDAKLRFEQQGCHATTVEELGFHYQPGETLEKSL